MVNSRIKIPTCYCRTTVKASLLERLESGTKAVGVGQLFKSESTKHRGQLRLYRLQLLLRTQYWQLINQLINLPAVLLYRLSVVTDSVLWTRPFVQPFCYGTFLDDKMRMSDEWVVEWLADLLYKVVLTISLTDPNWRNWSNVWRSLEIWLCREWVITKAVKLKLLTRWGWFLHFSRHTGFPSVFCSHRTLFP